MPENKNMSKTRELLEKLKKGISQVKSSEEFQTFLRAMSMFHQYSFHNCMLIAMQRPDATKVAGYRTWEKLGRHVKKGERGIAIFAPCKLRRKEPDEETEPDWILFFKTVHVFDVSQTEGEPLPKLTVNEIENTHESLLPALLKLCEQRGIEVSFEQLANYEGVSQMGRIIINKDKNPTEQAITLIHEIAHEMIHCTSEKRHQLTLEQKELEAEAVAWVISNFVGLPEINSEKYLALYQKTYNLMESLGVIYMTAQEILQAISPGDSETPAEQSKEGEFSSVSDNL